MAIFPAGLSPKGFGTMMRLAAVVGSGIGERLSGGIVVLMLSGKDE